MTEEILSERKGNSKTFNLGGNKRRFELSSGLIHYQEEPDNPVEPWLEIESGIVASNKPNWDWEVVKGNWHLLIKADTTIAIGKDGHWIGYRFNGVGYFRPETQDYEILFMAGSVTPTITENKIRWENIVAGVNLELIYTPDGLKENIEITQSARDWLSAHPPSDYGIPNNEAYIGGYFECDWRNAYSAEDKDGNPIDFDNDLDIRDTIFWKHPVKQHIVAFLPIGNSTVESGDLDAVRVPVRKRFFKHNEKHWLLFGSKATDLNSLPAGTIVIDPTTYTRQPADKDTHLYQGASTTNYGSDADLWVYDATNLIARTILEFDISAIPADVVFDSATLSIYYWKYIQANPSGKTVWAYKLLHPDWVESQATWVRYKTGSNWSSAGGDYVTSDPVGGSIVLGGYGWKAWDVLAIAQEAYDESNNVELLIKYATEPASASVLYFRSSEYSTASVRPKLVIEYTIAGGFAHSQGIMI